jgi:serine protease Do
MLRLAVFLTMPSLAAADTLDEWARAKVARQLETLERPQIASLSVETSAPDLRGFRGPPSFGPLVKAVRGAVVGLSTRNVGTSTSLGSGFLVSPSGLVVTNYHVVAKAEAITARLVDGRLFEADLVGSDLSTDLAVLKLAGARGLPHVAWGNSDSVAVGDWVLVIGKPLGLEATVTHGIVSAEDRALGAGPYDEFIQLSADINPGNSGGPLFDMRGEVVGVTTLASRAGQGVAFAVPSNVVKAVVPQLASRGRVRRGWVGLSVDERDEVLVVREVYPALLTCDPETYSKLWLTSRLRATEKHCATFRCNPPAPNSNSLCCAKAER